MSTPAYHGDERRRQAQMALDPRCAAAERRGTPSCGKAWRSADPRFTIEHGIDNWRVTVRVQPRALFQAAGTGRR